MEGIEVLDGENGMIADGPAEFATKVTALLLDRALRDRLARGARELMQERYTWESVAERFERTYYELAVS
jgi:glycosyltransferase involved in cell wall biosynthesis